MSAAPNITGVLWSASKLKTVHSCLVKYRNRYVLGLGEAETDPQRFGNALHRALESWLRSHHEGSERRLAAALESIGLADPWDAARARALILGYEARWGAARWRVIAVEIAFQYDLGGHIIHGRIDAIIEDLDDGRTYVLEHKTTGDRFDAGSTYWARLAVDTQVSVYVDGATILGHDVAGVIYDVLARPKHQPAKATPADKQKFTAGKGCKLCGGKASGVKGLGYGPAGGVCAVCSGTGWAEEPRLHAGQRAIDETVEEFEARVCDEIADDPAGFYQRGVIVRTDDQLPGMRSAIHDTIMLARICEERDLFPPNHDACRSYGSMCGFFDACSGAADINDLLRFPRRTRTESPTPSLP
jgi:hypothetical protein